MKKSHIIALVVLILGFQHGYAQKSQEIPKSWRLGTSDILLKGFTIADLKEASESGISSIEVTWQKFTKKTPSERAEHARLITQNSKKAGLEVWSTHLPFGGRFDISVLDEEARQNAVNSLKEYIDLALKMNVKQINVHPSAEPIAIETRGERILSCRKSLGELHAYIKGKNIALNIECLPRTCLGNTSEEILKILEGFPEIGICFDSNHLLQEKPEEFVNSVGNRIRMVHISDYDEIDEKHWMPGRGKNDWNKIISALLNHHFDGRFMYEVGKKEGDTFSVTALKANYDGLIKDWKLGNK